MCGASLMMWRVPFMYRKGTYGILCHRKHHQGAARGQGAHAARARGASGGDRQGGFVLGVGARCKSVAWRTSTPPCRRARPVPTARASPPTCSARWGQLPPRPESGNRSPALLAALDKGRRAARLSSRYKAFGLIGAGLRNRFRPVFIPDGWGRGRFASFSRVSGYQLTRGVIVCVPLRTPCS